MRSKIKSKNPTPHLRHVDEYQCTIHVEEIVLTQVAVDQPALVIHVAHTQHTLNVRILAGEGGGGGGKGMRKKKNQAQKKKKNMILSIRRHDGWMVFISSIVNTSLLIIICLFFLYPFVSSVISPLTRRKGLGFMQS